MNGTGHAVRALFEEDPDLIGAVVVVEQFDLPADQGHRRLEQPPVQCHGAVFGHASPGPLAEVVLKVLRGRPKALQVVGKTGKRTLPGGAVSPLVVQVRYPQIKGLVEFMQRVSLKAG